MSFEKKLRVRIAVFGALMVLGAAAFILSFYIPHAFAAGYFAGTGAALLVGGAIQIVHKLHLLRNEGKRNRARINEEDERNRLLSYKASHYTLLLAVFAGYAASILLAFHGKTAVTVVSFFICTLVLVRFFLYFILKKAV